jgi:hypothetical protein
MTAIFYTVISMGFSLLTIACLHLHLDGAICGILAAMAAFAMGRAIYAHEVS